MYALKPGEMLMEDGRKINLGSLFQPREVIISWDEVREKVSKAWGCPLPKDPLNISDFHLMMAMRATFKTKQEFDDKGNLVSWVIPGSL